MLDAVLAIEDSAYEFPWTRGNFIDSLAAGYTARTLRAADGALVGYFVAMAGVQEMHLLNLTVAPRRSRRGLARGLLDALVAQCRARGRATQLWLEVRESNQRARRSIAAMASPKSAAPRLLPGRPAGRARMPCVMRLRSGRAAAMRWSERQRAMLRAMGVHVWSPLPATPLRHPTPRSRRRRRHAARRRGSVAQRPRRAAASPARTARHAFDGSGRTPRPCRDRHARLGRVARGRGLVPRLRAVRIAHADGLRRRPPARALDDRRRSARRTGRPPGRALRRPRRAVARQHAARDRPDARRGAARATGLHRQHAQVPAAANRNPEPAETGAAARRSSIARSRSCSRASSWRWAASRRRRCWAATSRSGRLRGRVHRWRGVPVIVTYHPAYLLRTPADKARAWEDLCLAATLVEPG